jgi:hypothetical protein
MNLLTVFIFVLIIVLIYAVYKLLTKTTTTVSGFSDASKQLVVPGQKSSANFGYSVWIYVDAWKNRATAATQYKKNILTRLGIVYTNSNGATGTAPIYLLHLDNATNDLHLRIALNDGSTNKATTYQTCTIRNIKLQKWVNITMSIYGNTVDLYLEGKLVKTCVLTAMPVSPLNSDLYVGGSIGVSDSTDGDLSGYISNVLYKNDYFTPEDAWDIYSAGYGGAGMFDFSNRYKLNFSITKDNQTVGEVAF